MSHNVEKMMFTGKRPWWYGNSAQGSAVGVDLGENAVTSEVAIKEAGLDWEVRLSTAGFLEPNLLDVDGKPCWREIAEHKMLTRDIDGAFLGWATDRYKIIQNRTAFEYLDAIVGEGGGRYHTAGSLEGGKRVWILLQTPDSWTIKRRSGATNRHHSFLLNILGHDGGFGYRLLPTDVRAECANTVGFAEQGAAAEFLAFKIGHTGDVKAKLDLAATAIRTMAQLAPERRRVLQELAQAAMTSDEFIDFAVQVFLGIDGDVEEMKATVAKFYTEASQQSQTMMKNRVAAVAQLFEGGMANEGDSAYDALNAFTEYFDHFDIGQTRDKIEAGKKAAKAVTSSWLGIGAERKALAQRKLMRIVGA